MRKAISPLMGSVMLILLVVGVAGVVWQWEKPFTEQQTQIVDNESERVQKCLETRLKLLDVSHQNGDVNVTLMNAGFNEVEAVNIVITGSGMVVGNGRIQQLQSAEHRSVRVSTEGGVPETVVLVPTDCPMQTVEETLSS